MAARLPIPGQDDGVWGDILNDFLRQSHADDGTLKPLSQAQVTGLTQALVDAQTAADSALSSATVVGDDLVLSDNTGRQVDAGNVRGPKGDTGNPGDLTAATAGYPTAGQGLSLANLPSTRVWTLNTNVVMAAMPTPVAWVSGTITLIVRQAASGGPYTITWPSGVLWAENAPAPVMPTTANAELIVHLFWTGLAWRGMVAGVYYA